ncbi:Protein WHT-2, partial [Aphelenchoides avenae]
MGTSGDETTGLLRATAASITRKAPIPTNVPYQRLHTDSNGSYHADYGTSLRRRGYRTTSLMESLVKQVVLSWHELTVTHKKSGRVILDHVSGMAEPGQFVALMGASGAGKTTLLNALIARNLQGLEVKGEVLVDGRLLGRHITNSGYVQQDELFVANLTVREHLEIQARLRLVGVDEEERTGRIDS